jgi:hypothetical protein
MFFPRFTTRSLLALTGIAAAGFFVLGMAVEGYVWAGAASVVIVATCIAAAIHATLFALVWALSQALTLLKSQPATGGDPFAKQAYPLPVPSLAERLGQAAASPFSAASPIDNAPQNGSDGATPDDAIGDAETNDQPHD